MLDKLGSFHSLAMIKIWKLVDAHYTFCRRPDTLDYIAELLEKDKFLCDNIKNVSNQRHHCRSSAYRLTNYI